MRVLIHSIRLLCRSTAGKDTIARRFDPGTVRQGCRMLARLAITAFGFLVPVLPVTGVSPGDRRDHVPDVQLAAAEKGEGADPLEPGADRDAPTPPGNLIDAAFERWLFGGEGLRA